VQLRVITEPAYLHSVSVQPPRITRSSSFVTFASSSTSFSLQTTTRRSFRWYAPPGRWNGLSDPRRQPHSSLSFVPDSDHHHDE